MAAGLSPELSAAFERLLVRDARRRLPGETTDEVLALDIDEISRLVGAAACLALTTGHAERTVAYEIATRSVALAGKELPGLVRAAELILARLGNFPGRDLLHTRFQHAAVQDPLLWLEMQSREVENTTTDAGGKPRRLTDFQFDTLQTFLRNRAVSISAPTSAGKSFLLALEVLRKLRANPPACIAYIVPTRALIRQVIHGLRQQVAESELPPPLIRCVPRPETPEAAPNGIVYVLTQERLLSLLNPEVGDPWLTALIVDEAQGIGDRGRGILLHTAIEITLTRFPGAEVIFASPLAKNPEYLLEIFARPGGERVQEQHSPVSQNLILVEPVAGDRYAAGFSLLTEGRSQTLGERTLDFQFAGSSAIHRRARFAQAISGDDGCCIVYANGARDSEAVAHALSEVVPLLEPLDPDIAEFITYLQEQIHESYGLVEVLRHGVAFHYSNMPGSVRAGVEDLFQARKLRFICCTSTLLQGVNLPARDLVIESPRRGMKHPMQRADFLNLSGRAGRLRHEFHGNVWCLRPSEWETACYVGEPLQEIRSAFDRVLDDGGTAIRKVFDDEASVEDPETAIAALGRVFTEYVQKQRPLDESRHRTPDNAASLRETMARLQSIEVTLPPEVFARNSGVLPMRVEQLYQFFRAQADLTPMLPLRPFLSEPNGTNSRLKEIFQRVSITLGGIDNRSYAYHAVLASQWIHETTLRQIIDNAINYQTSQGEAVNVRNLIYELIDTIEHHLRFRYVKYLHAYNDVLAIALRERRQNEEADTLVPLHLYLECGASHPVAISLMSLGLSRIAALLLHRRITLAADASPEECLDRCRDAIRNAERISLPRAVIREVEALARG